MYKILLFLLVDSPLDLGTLRSIHSMGLHLVYLRYARVGMALGFGILLPLLLPGRRLVGSCHTLARKSYFCWLSLTCLIICLISKYVHTLVGITLGIMWKTRKPLCRGFLRERSNASGEPTNHLRTPSV